MSAVERDSDQIRAELYDIMQRDIDFEEKVRQSLNLGKMYLGVQNSHLTRIDEKADFWQAIASTDPPGGDFPPGQVLDYQTTYCRRVVEQGSSIALHDAPEQGWTNDPAFETHAVHCYHGTPITVDGELYGTLCFVDEDPRDEPFTEGETMFVELIARLLEHELTVMRRETDLALQGGLVTVLSRVLRHNLRNDLNVIRMWLEQIDNQASLDTQLYETSTAKIDRLIELAETAREIESIAGSDPDRQPVEVTRLVATLTDRLAETYSSASFSIESPGDISLEAFPTLRRALEELLENAAKHAGEASTVRIIVEETKDSVRIQVQDDGPGLPEQEQAVLDEGTEQPLIHGSGLGLWLVHWIVSVHDGHVETTVSETGTTVTLVVPNADIPMDVTDYDSVQQLFHREQDRFEAVFEESFDAIVVIDDDAQFIEVNESATELFGVEEANLLGRRFDQFTPDEYDFEAAWREFQEAGADRARFPLVRADGTRRIVEYSATSDIIPGQHLSVLRDVTEQVERQQELEQITERLDAVFEACPEPLMAVDTDGRIEQWNQAAEEVFGWRKEEVLGERPPTVPEEDSDLFEDHMQRMSDGQRFSGREVRQETKSGELIDTSISTAPIRDADGKVTGTVAILKDITERMARERELAETSQQLQGVLDTVPAAVFMKDTEGRYLLMNRHTREIAGLDAETSVTGMTDYDLFPEETAEEFTADDAFVLDTETTVKFVEDVPMPDGNGIRTHLTIKSPVFDEDGDMYGICAVSMNIEEFEQFDHERSGRRKLKSHKSR